MLLFNNINSNYVAEPVTPPKVNSSLQFGSAKQARTMLADAGKRSQSLGIANSDSKSNYQVWQSHNILNNGKKLKDNFKNEPVK